MVFNVTFNYISIISWRLVLLLEETVEQRRPVASKLQNIVITEIYSIYDGVIFMHCLK
jgi:hypothetical protein